MKAAATANGRLYLWRLVSHNDWKVVLDAAYRELTTRRTK